MLDFKAVAIRNIAALLCGLTLIGCDAPANPSTATSPSSHARTNENTEVDLEVVRNFFCDLGATEYTISRDDIGSDKRLRHVFHWVRDAIPSSHIGDHEIKELRLSPATTSSESAYELKIHQARGFGELLPGRVYVQLHAVHAASDPEFHGVIDGDKPLLLSFWGDGA